MNHDDEHSHGITCGRCGRSFQTMYLFGLYAPIARTARRNARAMASRYAVSPPAGSLTSPPRTASRGKVAPAPPQSPALSADFSATAFVAERTGPILNLDRQAPAPHTPVGPPRVRLPTWLVRQDSSQHSLHSRAPRTMPVPDPSPLADTYSAAVLSLWGDADEAATKKCVPC